MKKNMGKLDRLARIGVAVIIAILFATKAISGTMAIVLMIFAVIFMATSFISFCPLYLPFGFSTRKDENGKTL